MVDIARYEGAHAAAPRVAAHFASHIAAAQRDGLQTATAPAASTVESIVNAAFWASLHREEGYSPTISLAYLPPAQSARPMVFERAMPLAPAMLAKVSPAVERAGI